MAKDTVLSIVSSYSFSPTQITIFSFDILNKAQVPVDQIRYITMGFGGSEVLATITSVRYILKL